jgi:hypothetical protein
VETLGLVLIGYDGQSLYLPDSAQKHEKYVVQIAFSLISAVSNQIFGQTWLTSKAQNFLSINTNNVKNILLQ